MGRTCPTHLVQCTGTRGAEYHHHHHGQCHGDWSLDACCFGCGILYPIDVYVLTQTLSNTQTKTVSHHVSPKSSLGSTFVLFHTHAVAGYFISRGLLEGRDWIGVADKLNEKCIPTLWTSWHFWPAANVLNFAMVPLQFRVLYWSVLSFFWQGYLTHTNEQQET